ncbi:MAG: winged helix-turn-helix domain-containing protein [Xanthomonadales bacterium]|nr:winged helix-turn-helix domain-containing protein [Xanthomonadales bacterium]
MSGDQYLRSFAFGSYVLEGRLQRLVQDGSIVPLKPKAYDLLCLLLANRDRTLGKDELLDYLWPRQDIGEANLTQTVYELRQALGEAARESRWIETIPRRGYRFKGDVSEPQDQPASDMPKSIAVLPFRALTSQPEMQDLGMGIADAVILSLCSTGQVVVRPLSAVLPYGNTEQDSLTIGQHLDVDTVLEGTLQQFGDRVRASARLLSCPDGEDIWTGRQESDAADLFAVQDRMARRAADAIAVNLGHDQCARRYNPHGSNAEVHALYLKARYCWQRWVPDASRQALDYLDAAIALDPEHAPSQAWRAAAWSTLAILGAVAPREAARNAREAAQRAIEIDDLFADGYEMLGAVQLFFDWDLNAAASSVDHAIELNPSSSNARHLRAITLSLGGHDQAGLAEMIRAVRADPSSLIANSDMGMVHYWGRRYGEAKRWFETTLEQAPDFAHARSGLAFTLLELGHADAAVAEIRLAAESRGRNAPGELAYVLGRAGRRQEARELLQGLLDAKDDRIVDPYLLVLAYLGAGDYDQAFQWLGKAIDHRSRDLVLLGVNPIVDPIRDDPRFGDVMLKVAL